VAEIYSCFPGTGKTYYYNTVKDKVVRDSDSSKFSKDHFPKNYVYYIENIMSVSDIILISTHQEVRNQLIEDEIEFTIILPNIGLKEEYIDRYRERGSDEKFIDLISINWDNWIMELMVQEDCNNIILSEGQYVADVI
jgi:hypothetical protein